ncbi:MAG: hypothetical protein P8M70_05855, partial [Verrucomicrobiota bacterium]|nr:hypothetical protein [Verrucomicrobiota bacterium]
MKVLISILIGLLVVGCGKKQSTNTNESSNTPEKLIADPIVEKAIRKRLKKPKGELTKADMEKVIYLNLSDNKLTDVKGLENILQFKALFLNDNKLTKL